MSLPRLEVNIFKTVNDRKGVCDALLIGMKTIASTHGCILFGDRACVPTAACDPIRVEIANPKTAEFVPLLGSFNFEHKPMGGLGIPDEFSFRIQKLSALCSGAFDEGGVHCAAKQRGSYC